MWIIVMLFLAEIFSTSLQRIFCESTLHKKKNGGYIDLIVWSSYFIVFNLSTYLINFFTGIAWLNLLIFVLDFFVTIRILYSNPTRTLIAVTIFMYLSGMCSELLVYYGKDLLPLLSESGGDIDLLCTVLTKIVWFFIIKLVSLLIDRKRKPELNIQDWLEVFIVPVGSIWILLAIFVTGTLENRLFGFIAVIMILVINIFTYDLYEKAKETMEKRMREQALEKQCLYYIRQNAESQEWWDELRRFRHDMKQRFILEKTYLEQKDYGALEKYCNENLNFLDRKNCASNTGNVYVDSIVNYKADMAEKVGVEFRTDIKIPRDAELDAEDISICLGNLLDNAIDAVKALEKDKTIQIQIHADGHNLFIRIMNRYTHKIQKERDRYISNKNDGDDHGLGLLIVRQIVEKYVGNMTIHDEDGVFDVTLLLYDFLK